MKKKWHYEKGRFTQLQRKTYYPEQNLCSSWVGKRGFEEWNVCERFL